MNEISEKLGTVIASSKAAHQRLDRLEIGLREDLTTLNKELKELNAYMNRGKGWVAAFVLLSGVSGAGIIKLITVFFSK